MWYSGGYQGYAWEAKVYDVGSRFGINCGRVSKLTIWKGLRRFGHTEVYNYDRGLEYDHCPPDILAGILQQCEALPKEGD